MANVILLFLDDAQADAIDFMPWSKSMASRRGTIFTKAYSNGPLCGPARGSVMTGRLPTKNGVRNNGDAMSNWDDFIAPWLVEKSWGTAMVGKWGIGAAPIPLDAGWTRIYRTTAADDQNHYNCNVFDDSTTPALTSGWLVDNQAQVIRDFSDSEAGNWFAYWPTNAPHWPFVSDHKYPLRGKDKNIPMTFPPQTGTNWPSWIEDLPPITDWSSENTTRREQAAECMTIDRNLKEVWEHLEATGAANETTVIICSDNGRHGGDHRIQGAGSKNTCYEAASHVPLVVWGPGFPAQQVVDVPVSVIDITATIVAQADAEPTTTLDGTDLREIASNPSNFSDRGIVLQIYRSGSCPSANAVVTKTHKLIRYESGGVFDPLPGEEYELYNLSTDPDEVNNIAYEPEHLTLRNSLETKLNTLLA